MGPAADDPRRNTTAVLNLLEADRPELATTLLPPLLETLARNVSRGFGDVALFSIAQVVHPTAQTRAVELIPTDRRPTDDEIAHLNARCRCSRCTSGPCWPGCGSPAGRGARAGRNRGSRRLRRRPGDRAGLRVEVTLRPARYLPWHPGRCAEVVVDGRVVGHAGQLHPAVVERCGLPKGTCAVELDLDAVPVVDSARAAGLAVPGVPGP